MSAMRLLEGEVEDPADRERERLQADVAALRQQLAIANEATLRARRESARALAVLRRQLAPLYRALQDVFGELDAAGVEDSSPSATPLPDARLKAIWDGWKGRLGPTCAKVIDALLLQPEMTNRQIAMAIGTSRIQTIYDAVAKMNKASLLTKNGDRYSLKSL